MNRRSVLAKAFGVVAAFVAAPFLPKSSANEVAKIDDTVGSVLHCTTRADGTRVFYVDVPADKAKRFLEALHHSLAARKSKSARSWFAGDASQTRISWTN